MSEFDVKTALKARSSKPTDSERGEAGAKSYLGWIVRDLEFSGMSGTAFVRFDSTSRRMNEVMLKIERRGEDGRQAGEALITILNNLRVKYGDPFDANTKAEALKRFAWRQNGQTVELTAILANDGPTLIVIKYAPISRVKDL